MSSYMLKINHIYIYIYNNPLILNVLYNYNPNLYYYFFVALDKIINIHLFTIYILETFLIKKN